MINFRKAEISDINSILNLNNDLCKFEMEEGFDNYIKDWSLCDESREYFLDLIKNHFVIVAEKNEKIVGYLAGSINEEGAYSYYEGKTAELQNMFILNDYRKFGIGSKLINNFENWCKDNQVKRMMVTHPLAMSQLNDFTEKMALKILT